MSVRLLLFIACTLAISACNESNPNQAPVSSSAPPAKSADGNPESAESGTAKREGLSKNAGALPNLITHSSREEVAVGVAYPEGWGTGNEMEWLIKDAQGLVLLDLQQHKRRTNSKPDSTNKAVRPARPDQSAPEFRAAIDSADYFRQNCHACHTIGGTRLAGPDLKSVTKRKDRAWLIRFVLDPQAVIDSGDPYALKLFEEARKVVMPQVPRMTRERATKLLDLIESESKLGTSRFTGQKLVAPDFDKSRVNPLALLNSKSLQADLRLTGEQIDRIRQYNLQCEGVRALRRDEIAEQLGITARQKATIADVYAAYEQKRKEFEKVKVSDATVVKRAYKELEQAYRGIDQQVINVLTEKQRKQFEEMKGKPFDPKQLDP